MLNIIPKGLDNIAEYLPQAVVRDIYHLVILNVIRKTLVLSGIFNQPSPQILKNYIRCVVKP